MGETYPLLRETTGTLVLGVAEEFDDALLVGGKAVQLLAQALRRWCWRQWQALHVCAVHHYCTSRCEQTYPATSRVISLTKAVRLDRKPFLLEILAAGVLGVTSVFR